MHRDHRAGRRLPQQGSDRLLQGAEDQEAEGLGGVGGRAAHNEPDGRPASADGEVMLDIEVAGAVAPGAKIVVYFAPNTDAGLPRRDHAPRSTTRDASPSVISISWGGAEATGPRRRCAASTRRFTDAAAMGVTVAWRPATTARRRRRRRRPRARRLPGVEPVRRWPAAARRSRRRRRDQRRGRLERPRRRRHRRRRQRRSSRCRPTRKAGVPPRSTPGKVGRGVPDVAGNADPRPATRSASTGDRPIGGTSAVAPLWAGLIALLNRAARQPIGSSRRSSTRSARPPGASRHHRAATTA